MQANSLPNAVPAGAPLPVKDRKWAEREYDAAYECYFRGDWLTAEGHIRRALEVVENSPQYHLLAAQIYSARGWLSMALSELHSLKELDPHNPGAKSLELLLKSKLSEKSLKNSKSNKRITGWRAVISRWIS